MCALRFHPDVEKRNLKLNLLRGVSARDQPFLRIIITINYREHDAILAVPNTKRAASRPPV